jgi:hypothetical protein
MLLLLPSGLMNFEVPDVSPKVDTEGRAFGFHSADALIGLAILSFGGLQLVLPGRAA